MAHRRSLVHFARAAVAVAAIAVAGCARFDVPRYSVLVRETYERSQLLASLAAPEYCNRAARLPGHSQSAIRQEIAWLWTPSRRLGDIHNRMGLLATRFSQFETTPGKEFHAEELQVVHRGRTFRLPYLAAFHTGKRLPLVVAVSGINSTTQGKFSIDILQRLYSTGQFHVLNLGSLTSIEYNERNHQVFAGGFPEGYLLYRALEQLRSQSPYASQIEQLHLIGVSYAGLVCGIAGHCESVFQHGVIDGAILAYSPPMDLQRLFNDLAQSRIVRERVRESYLLSGTQLAAENAGLAIPPAAFENLTFESYVSRVAVPFAQRIRPELMGDFPSLPEFEDAADVYGVSSMRPFVNRLGVPFFMVAAYDDPVVSPVGHHGEILAECSNPLVDGVLVHDGGHLGFDLVSGGYPARVAEQYFRYWSATAETSSAE